MPQNRSFARLSLLVALSLPCSAIAGPEKEKRTCFETARVRSWSAIDRRTLKVETHGGNAYRLTVGGLCPDLRWARVVAFRSTTGRLCGYAGEKIRVERQRCWVESVGPWTDDSESPEP